MVDTRLRIVDAICGPEPGRGRPTKPDRKVNQTLRLDQRVVEAYPAMGTAGRR